MDNTASIVKITRTVYTNVFSRTHLFPLLDHARKKPVIWIAGPAGCGKTTLINSYIKERGASALWYQIDDGVKDAATFFFYMDFAAKRVVRDNKIQLPSLFPKCFEDISEFYLRHFERLYKRIKIPGLIVFDNYDVVQTESPFNELIRCGLSRIPEGLNIILISRKNPPSELIRMRINRQMEVLGWNELRLTLKESKEIVGFQKDKNFSDESITCLHKVTDGWVAGLVLMSQKLNPEDIKFDSIRKQTPEEIFEYFEKEVFEKTTNDTQQFLLKSALLPIMSVKMTKTLTDYPEAENLLSELNRNNYFTEKVDLKEPSYRYHPLFRDFLIARAKRSFSLTNWSILCRHAARILEENNQTEAAVAVLNDSDNLDAKIALITKNASLMLSKGRYRLVEQWLNSLPKEVIEDCPLFLYWMGASILPFDPSKSRAFFEKAFERFEFDKDVNGKFLAWSGIIESIVYGFEDFSLLDPWIQLLKKATESSNILPSRDIEAVVASRMLMALVFRQPQHLEEIETWGEWALTLTRECRHINAEIDTLAHLAFYQILKGNFKKAYFVLETMRQLLRSEQAGPLSKIRAGFVEAMYFQFMGMHDKCIKVVSDCLVLSRSSGIHIMDTMLITQSISSYLNVADCTMADKQLDEMFPYVNLSKPWESLHYHLVKTRAALILGDLKQALLHADMSLELTVHSGFPFLLGVCYLAKSHVMHLLGQYKDAEKQLLYSFNIARRMKSNLLKFYCFWAKALFMFDRDEENSALKSLQKAVLIGEKHRYLNTFLDNPLTTAKLCAKAIKADIEVDYMQDIIRKRKLITNNPPISLAKWPWDLKIYTLGRFALVKDGKSLQFSRKAQQMPLSILKALIAFGGRNVTKEQIIDSLWPEADGDMGQKSFSTTLHRLRKLLGNPKAVELSNGCLKLDQKYCWVDAWAFERIFGQADAVWKNAKSKSDEAKAVKLAQEAVNLYQGSFLSGEMNEPWTKSLRECLRSKYQRAVCKLGNYWETVGQWEKAVECLQRSLEVDDLAEESYRRLMLCYYRLSRRAEALSVYERCKKVLLAAFGIEPSFETQSVRRLLLLYKK